MTELRDQPTQPGINRERVLERGPEMVALKTEVDGMPIVLNVSPVIGEARGRGIAPRRYSINKVS